MSERRNKPATYELVENDFGLIKGLFKKIEKQFETRLEEQFFRFSDIEINQLETNASQVVLELTRAYVENLKILNLDPKKLAFSTTLAPKTYAVFGETKPGQLIILINFFWFVGQIMNYSKQPNRVRSAIRYTIAHECFHVYTFKYYPTTMHKSFHAYNQIEADKGIYESDRGELAANLYAIQHMENYQTNQKQTESNLLFANYYRKQYLKPPSPPKNN